MNIVKSLAGAAVALGLAGAGLPAAAAVPASNEATAATLSSGVWRGEPVSLRKARDLLPRLLTDHERRGATRSSGREDSRGDPCTI